MPFALWGAGAKQKYPNGTTGLSPGFNPGDTLSNPQ
jgi:hypothetical protein